MRVFKSNKQGHPYLKGQPHEPPEPSGQVLPVGHELKPVLQIRIRIICPDPHSTLRIRIWVGDHVKALKYIAADISVERCRNNNNKFEAYV